MADEFVSGAQGFLGGAGTGAAIGSSILPGWGTAIGAVLGGTVGAISGANKANKMNEAMDALMAIPEVDPNMLAFQDELRREKRAVESGFSTDFQVARDIISKSEAGGMSVAAELALTNPALSLMAMNQVGQSADTSVNKALGTISTKGMGYTQMLGDLIEKMSMRKMQVQIMKATQGTGMAAKDLNNFNTNMNAGMMKLGELSDLGPLFAGVGKGNVLPASNFNYMDSAVSPLPGAGTVILPDTPTA